jgi:anti-sigma regulatory factor (Ser/Thr protein kinase)
VEEAQVAAGAPRDRIQQTFQIGDTTAPRQARRAAAALDGDPGTSPDLQIVVSELVANAVRYAPPGAGAAISLTIVRGDEDFYIEVRDPGHGFDPRHVTADGIGLLTVSRIADSWGVEGGDDTTVWCRIRRGRPR